MKRELVFVYGTLKKGGALHHHLHEAAPVDDHAVLLDYTLYMAGGVPAMVRSEGKEVYGEVYAVPWHAVTHLDKIEGDGKLYYRHRLTLCNGVKVWAYVWVHGTSGLNPIGAYYDAAAAFKELTADHLTLRYPSARRLLGPGIWCFVFSALAKHSAEKAKSFAEQLDSGENLAKGMPVHTLRERLIANKNAKAKINRFMVAAYAVKAAIAHLHGRPLKKLLWIEGEGFPEFPKAKK